MIVESLARTDGGWIEEPGAHIFYRRFGPFGVCVEPATANGEWWRSYLYIWTYGWGSPHVRLGLYGSADFAKAHAAADVARVLLEASSTCACFPWKRCSRHETDRPTEAERGS